MSKQHGFTRIFALLLGAAALVMAGWASADPPARVARLGYISGAVSFSPAGEEDWVLATMNRPLITGDRLWVDAGARAELQVGSAVIRMSGSTSVTLLNLEDRVAQVQLAQGTLNVRVRRFDPNEVIEVDTPNLAYSIRRAGEYRIDVDPAGNATTAVVRSGQAEVYGDGAVYVINAQQAYRFAGTDLSDYDYFGAPRADEFDRWSSDRDRRGAVAARYVSRDVIGYEDLDDYGTWRADEGYGNVWVPTRVAAGWAPYRDGHWAWVDPWGWTWVDDAPWGFAVSHYGRWANIRGTWGWVPGPVRSRAVYAPALVAFVGGSNLQVAISTGLVAGIAWFALGPRDVYRPSYPVSQRYFNNINTTNTTINTTNITNVYNNTNVRNITYVNQRVPNAIVAVPNTAFVQSQPVGRAAVRLPKEAIAKAQVTAVAAVAPVQASVHGAARPGSRPPAEALKRPVVARKPPPPAPVPFAAKQSALAANPGRPLDAAALAAVKPAAPAPAPAIKVVSPTQRAVAPPKKQAVAPGGPQASGQTKGVERPEARKGPQPSEAKKGPPAREAEKAARSPVSVPKPPAAEKAPPPPEAQKQPQRPEAKEARQPPEARKAPQPPVSVQRPPEAQKAPPPEAKKGPQPSEAKKEPPAREAEKAARSPVSVPKPPAAEKAPPPPEAQKQPQRPEAKEARQPPEARKAPQPPVSVQRPPEAQKAPPPEAKKGPQPSEAKKEPPAREAEKAARSPVSVPKPPAAEKAPPPPEAQKQPQRPEAKEARQPPEARKAPQPPVSVQRPPEPQKPPQRPEVQAVPKPPVTVPTPKEAQKALPPKPDAAKSAEKGKSAEKRGAKKSDEQLKREEEAAKSEQGAAK